MVSDLIDSGFLEDDCSVKDASKMLSHLTGKHITVTKKDITDISEIKKATPVKFYYKGYTPHWVVVENGKIVFNSIIKSYSVDNGTPVSARIIKGL